MADLQISWSIEGDKELSRVLTGLATELKDFRQPFSSAADYLTRTFSKAHALAGLRIGYMLSHPSVAAGLLFGWRTEDRSRGDQGCAGAAIPSGQHSFHRTHDR